MARQRQTAAQAQQELIDQLSRQADAVRRLNMAASSPTLSLGRQAYGRATSLSQDRLAGTDAAFEMSQRMAGRRGPQDFRGRALASVSASLAAQEQQVATLRQGNEPRTLALSLRYQQEIVRLERQREEARARSGLNPQGVREQVAHEGRMAEIAEKRARLEARERGRRSPGATLGGAAMDLARSLPGGGVAGSLGRAFADAAGPKAAQLSGAMSGLGAAAAPLGAVVAAAPAAVEALGQVKDTIVSLGGTASPGALIRWELAVGRLQTTIGQRLAPMLELMSKGVDLAADSLHTFLPSMGEVQQMFRPLHDSLRNDLRPAVEQAAPAVRSLAGLLAGELAGAVRIVSLEIKRAEGLMKVLRWTNPALTALGGPGKLDKAPLRPQSPVMTDIESYLKDSYAKALHQAMGSGGDPAAVTADATTRAATTLERILLLINPLGAALLGGRGDDDVRAARRRAATRS